MTVVRPPAVAGFFYPQEPQQLAQLVDQLLAEAPGRLLAGIGDQPTRAVIEPHAGYRFSGAIAALGFHRLAQQRDRIARVVVLGPLHRVAVRGLALPGADIFRTPLGDLRVDAEAVAALSALPQVSERPDAHAPEHSLEVQLPFIQRICPEATIVPVAVGAASAEAVAEAISVLWSDSATAFVVSSDLSHYHPYADAQRMDDATVEQILRREPTLTGEQACGARPVNGLLEFARQQDLTLRLLGMCNSGDTAGDHSRVVGYSSFDCLEGGDPRGDDD